MSIQFSATPEWRRDLFASAADTPALEATASADVLRLLLAQDGSTTRLCETIAGATIQVVVHHQQVASAPPASVRQALPGQHFMERVTTLVAHGQAMMDNLSYIALDGLPPDIRADLEAGTLPIGHLLARLWVRRAPLAAQDDARDLLQHLWGRVGLPDPAASRAYAIHTPQGACMVIAETYRGGMRMRRP